MNSKVLKLCITTLMIALCYVGFAFIKIPIGTSAFHLGNVFCLLASLLLGSTVGGIAGAIGMGIGDIMIPAYLPIAPKTIILKMVMGIVCGFFAHKVFKITEYTGKKQIIRVALSSLFGAIINIVLEPTFGYFYYKYVLLQQDKALNTLVSFNILATSINAIISVIISVILYITVAHRFKNNELLKKLHK